MQRQHLKLDFVIPWLATFMAGLFILVSALPITANAVVGLTASSTQEAEGILLRFKPSVNNQTRQQVLQVPVVRKPNGFAWYRG